MTMDEKRVFFNNIDQEFELSTTCPECEGEYTLSWSDWMDVLAFGPATCECGERLNIEERMNAYAVR